MASVPKALALIVIHHGIFSENAGMLALFLAKITHKQGSGCGA